MMHIDERAQTGTKETPPGTAETTFSRSHGLRISIYDLIFCLYLFIIFKLRQVAFCLHQPSNCLRRKPQEIAQISNFGSAHVLDNRVEAASALVANFHDGEVGSAAVVVVVEIGEKGDHALAAGRDLVVVMRRFRVDVVVVEVDRSGIFGTIMGGWEEVRGTVRGYGLAASMAQPG